MIARCLAALLVLTFTGCTCASSAPVDAATIDAPAERDAASLDAGADARLTQSDASDASSDVAGYDTCDAPLDVSAGGTFSFDLAGIHSDYPEAFRGLACGGLGPTDLCLD